MAHEVMVLIADVKILRRVHLWTLLCLQGLRAASSWSRLNAVVVDVTLDCRVSMAAERPHAHRYFSGIMSLLQDGAVLDSPHQLVGPPVPATQAIASPYEKCFTSGLRRF